MRYVALLRGINVSGNMMVKMADLKAVFDAAGFENVATYINSGNVGFDARKGTNAAIAKKIESAIESGLGKRIRVIVRSRDEIEKVIAAHPFAGKHETHKQMHVLFTDAPMSADQVEALMEKETAREKFRVIGNEIYAMLLDGVADSVLGKSFLEKKLGVMYTGRNWRTVERLATL